jgi:hypothetical protein
MVIGTAADTVTLSVALAFLSGYALTMRGIRRVGLAYWLFRASLAGSLAVPFLFHHAGEPVDDLPWPGTCGRRPRAGWQRAAECLVTPDR